MNLHKLFAIAALSGSFALSGGGVAWAAGAPWTATGSSGSVDEADLSEVIFSSATASILSTAAPSSTVVLRYNVVAAPDLADGGVNKLMTLRFLDNGPNARVRATLRRYNLSNGSISDLLSFDSATLSESPLQRTVSVGDGCFRGAFDFSTYAYYVEVELSRSAVAGSASISGIRIEDLDVC